MLHDQAQLPVLHAVPIDATDMGTGTRRKDGSFNLLTEGVNILFAQRVSRQLFNRNLSAECMNQKMAAFTQELADVERPGIAKDHIASSRQAECHPSQRAQKSGSEDRSHNAKQLTFMSLPPSFNWPS